MSKDMKEIIVALAGLALLVIGTFALEILDVIVAGRPSTFQVIVGTAIPLGLGFLMVGRVGWAWFKRSK